MFWLLLMCRLYQLCQCCNRFPKSEAIQVLTLVSISSLPLLQYPSFLSFSFLFLSFTFTFPSFLSFFLISILSIGSGTYCRCIWFHGFLCFSFFFFFKIIVFLKEEQRKQQFWWKVRCYAESTVEGLLLTPLLLKY